MKAATLLLLVFLMCSCATFYKTADIHNPCSNRDQAECEKWKKEYPKEYEKYVARMKKDAASTSY